MKTKTLIKAAAIVSLCLVMGSVAPCKAASDAFLKIPSKVDKPFCQNNLHLIV